MRQTLARAAARAQPERHSTPRPGGRLPRHDDRGGRDRDQAARRPAGRAPAEGPRRHASCSRSRGGHLFSIYDGCREEGIDIVDVRHESAAAFAAEGWAKVTREPGVCALTAGPGVTNGMSAMTSALQNRSPMLVLGGRAPAWRWGQGSLQEIDHVPFVRPVTKFAATAGSTAEIPALVDEALAGGAAPALGPGVRRLPARLRVLRGRGASAERRPRSPRARDVDGAALDRAAALLRDAERPVIMAGNGLYWARGEDALRELAERLGVPVFLNGLARGCLPADHELFFARARSAGLKGADVALVIGVPMDFRLGFGGAFGEETELVVLDARGARARPPARGRRRALRRRRRPRCGALAQRRAGGADTRPWVEQLRGDRDGEARGRGGGLRRRPLAAAPDAPLPRAGRRARPRRDPDRRRRRLRLLRRPRGRHLPARLLAGPGPVRLPGQRAGLRARGQARPSRTARSCCCSATARSASRAWSSTRSRATASRSSACIGNNGIWALEKHPMEYLYGYSVAAELTAGDALRPGGRGARRARRAGAHARRAARRRSSARSSAGRPALVNVLTDPAVVYPRAANLA